MQQSLLRILAILIIAGSISPAAAGDYSLGGYAKSYFSLFDPASVQEAGGTGIDPSPEALLSNRLRLQASYSPKPSLRFEAAYDLAPRFQSEGLTGGAFPAGGIDPFSYRAVDLDPTLYPTEQGSAPHFSLGQNLDRASLTVRTRPADITIGRQAVAWGSARAVNPTDVLAPFTFETLDTEDRIGIDAVRVRVPLGTLSEIDAGYVFGKDFEFGESAFYARTGLNFLRTDLSVLVMGFRGNLLLGVDLARPLGGAGAWLEAAGVIAGALARENNPTDENYFRASAGMDYNFTGELYGFLEYHFNGAGASRAAEYTSLYDKTAYTEGAVYLLGRHYLIPGVVYQFSPLCTVTFQSLINVTDPSVFLAPQVEYNISPNVYIGAGAFIGIGKKPVLGDTASSVDLRSEFGGYSNLYHASLRRYF
jgi:hypothetical protein